LARREGGFVGFQVWQEKQRTRSWCGRRNEGILVVYDVIDSSTQQGKVKWFSDQKGYGFIARDDNVDVFVHHSAIKMEGFRTLRQGEDVLYELRDGEKGPQALNVVKWEKLDRDEQPDEQDELAEA